jgi:hypothetical protein
MKHGCIAVLALGLGFVALGAQAQHRFTTEATVGIDQIPFVVNDLDAAEDVWRRLGFRLKPGQPHANGIENALVRFEDGSGIELLTVPAAVDETTTRYRALLEAAEGPALFSLHARDLGKLKEELSQTRFNYGAVSHTLDHPSFDYLFFVGDSRQKDDAAWLAHPNGATAMSRVWIAVPRRAGNDLQRMLEVVNAEITLGKVYAPEAVETKIAAVSNGEILILPEARQLAENRPVIGATFEVESIAAMRRRLADFGIPFTVGGVRDQSLVVAPEITHGLWVEFRE